MAPSPNRRVSALVPYTWQGETGLVVVSNSPKGDTWVLPGAQPDARENELQAIMRGVSDDTTMLPFGIVTLFVHPPRSEHRIYLVRASGSPVIRGSTIKAIGLLLPDMSVAQIALRQRYSWPASVAVNVQKIAERYNELRDQEPAFFEGFERYSYEEGDDSCSFD
jgi:hypothetical protein